MLRTRILTAAVLACLLLAGLFLLPPPGRSWRSARSSPSAPGNGRVSARRAAPRPRRLCGGHRAAAAAHLEMERVAGALAAAAWVAACLWWVDRARVAHRGAVPPHPACWSLALRAAGAGAGLRRSGEASGHDARLRAWSANRAVAGADGDRRRCRRVLRRAQLGQAEIGAARKSGQDLGGRARRAVARGAGRLGRRRALRLAAARPV